MCPSVSSVRFSKEAAREFAIFGQTLQIYNRSAQKFTILPLNFKYFGFAALFWTKIFGQENFFGNFSTAKKLWGPRLLYNKSGTDQSDWSLSLSRRSK